MLHTKELHNASPRPRGRMIYRSCLEVFIVNVILRYDSPHTTMDRAVRPGNEQTGCKECIDYGESYE